ncbi:natriuretic peptides B [Polymixia lowei]
MCCYGLSIETATKRVFSSHPISLSDRDVDVLKVLLQRLEESVPDQTELEQIAAERLNDEAAEAERDGEQLRTGLDEAAIRDFLSAKNLKTVRNDSTRRSSGCFGRRMDRIGSMSSLGCNTVGRYT